jgi:hypothetical protein
MKTAVKPARGVVRSSNVEPTFLSEIAIAAIERTPNNALIGRLMKPSGMWSLAKITIGY